MSLAQGAVDLAALTRRIRAAFPGLAFERAALNDDGEDHAVVILDDAWVFRFPRTATAAAAALGERRLLEALAPVCPVAVPRYVHVAPDFAGYPMIAGRELGEAVFAGLPAAAQGRVLDDIADALKALHALPLALAPGPARSEPAQAHARAWTERRERLAAVLPADLATRLDGFYAALARAVAVAPMVVAHRDFTEDHLLLARSGDRLAGVIDFTDAGVGDPAFDFTFLWAYGAAAAERIAARYGADPALVTRSRWWFVRYRLDQFWWSITGDRAYDVEPIVADLPAALDALGL